MTNLATKKQSLSLWQRLLIVLNAGGPQWGRPQGGGNNGDRKDEPQEDYEEDERDDASDREQEPNKPKGRPDRNRSSEEDESPPDLDEIWKDLSGRLGGLLGDGGKGGSGRRPPRRSGSSGGRPPISGKGASLGAGVILFFVVMAWISSGLFTVQEGQRAVILTFGKHTRTVNPGLSWRLPYPIESDIIVATDQLKSVDIGNANVNPITGLNNASMLTQDKNILDIRFTVQYRIKNIENFLFFNVNPDDAVKQAAESAVREVVGRSPMDVVIQRESCSAPPLNPQERQDVQSIEQNIDRTQTALGVQGNNDVGMSGSTIDSVIEQIGNDAVIIPRETTVSNIKATCDGGTKQESLSNPILVSIQSQLDKLNTGIEIFNVNILDVQVPDKVKPAFDEARSATAERASLINEGWAYANATVASAKGVVARLEADANAYKMSAVSKAEGETQRFVEIYEQYRLAPEVTRRRMYLEAMQEVYSSVSKVMVDSKDNNSLLYLPLDRLINPQSEGVRAVTTENLPVQSPLSNSNGNEAAASQASVSPTSNASAAQQGSGIRAVNRSR